MIGRYPDPLPEARLRQVDGSAVGIRLSTAGAVALATFYAATAFGQIVVSATSWGVVEAAGAALTVAIFALHVRTLLAAMHGRRAAAPGTTFLALFALVLAGALLPSTPGWWFNQFHVPLVGAVLLLRMPWRAVAVALIALTLGYFTFGVGVVDVVNSGWLVLWRAGETLLFVWMAAALRGLVATREAIAEEALLAERRRIDDELHGTLGSAIEAVAGAAEDLAARADTEASVAASEVDAVIERSRAALAEVRRVARSSRRSSLGAELATTVRLLTDAGIHTRLELPDVVLDAVAADGVRRELRTALADLLADRSVRSCQLAVLADGAGARLAVRAVRERS